MKRGSKGDVIDGCCDDLILRGNFCEGVSLLLLLLLLLLLHLQLRCDVRHVNIHLKLFRLASAIQEELSKSDASNRSRYMQSELWIS